MEFKDYYNILGISYLASNEEIKSAYREQSLKWHPDKNPNIDTTQQMQDINEAYQILKNSDSKTLYDIEYKRIKGINSNNHSKNNSQHNSNNSSNNNSDNYYTYNDYTYNNYTYENKDFEDYVHKARKSAKEYVEELKKNLKQDFNVAGEEIKTSLITLLYAIGIIIIINIIIFIVHSLK